MTRRASLPGAAELFRSTTRPDAAEQSGAERRQTSGRQRHESKITVYVSEQELVELERTRLSLRADYGLIADRGRIVREAIAMLLADFEKSGPDSVLLRRLADRTEQEERGG